MNRRFAKDTAKDSEKMYFATALREAKEQREAKDAATGIAASASAAEPPAAEEPEPRSEELVTWKQIRFMDLVMTFPGVVDDHIEDKQQAYG
eukprot:12900617-Prorocentrum_lima.AAC.1